MSLHNLYSETNFGNRTSFANEGGSCSKFSDGISNIADIIQVLKDNKSENYDQRGIDLIEEMKKTVKIGEECFKRERRFKSGDSDEWKWSSYLSSFHICLPLLGKPSKKWTRYFMTSSQKVAVLKPNFLNIFSYKHILDFYLSKCGFSSVCIKKFP